jgi:hypothetical protein
MTSIVVVWLNQTSTVEAFDEGVCVSLKRPRAAARWAGVSCVAASFAMASGEMFIGGIVVKKGCVRSSSPRKVSPKMAQKWCKSCFSSEGLDYRVGVDVNKWSWRIPSRVSIESMYN